MSDNPQISVTPCDGCPCLNTDSEDGYECNLGFTVETYYLQDWCWTHASPDCGLTCVASSKSVFNRPATILVRNPADKRPTPACQLVVPRFGPTILRKMYRPFSAQTPPGENYDEAMKRFEEKMRKEIESSLSPCPCPICVFEREQAKKGNP